MTNKEPSTPAPIDHATLRVMAEKITRDFGMLNSSQQMQSAALQNIGDSLYALFSALGVLPQTPQQFARPVESKPEADPKIAKST
jgi:hypothetical protein